jgi:predicted ribosomally synthesized peptide with SipW-like signal peptide
MLQALNIGRIAAALALVALVATAGFVGTRAFFSDQEVSQANTLTAGSLNLQVGIENRGGLTPDPRSPIDLTSNQALFSFGGMIPGQMEVGHFKLESSQDAWACLAGDVTATYENTHLTQEQSAGDNTGGTNKGELQDYIEVAVWEANGGNTDGVVGTSENDTLRVMPLNDFASGDYMALQDSANGDNPLDSGAEYGHEFAYCFGQFSNADDVKANGGTLECDGGAFGSETNRAQTDSVETTLTFYGEQRDNNEDFTCGSLNPLNNPETHTLSGVSVPAEITVEDLGGAIRWTIDIDETTADDDNGHYQYALVISNDGVNPAFQIHGNDGVDGTYPWGTHLYSPWGPSGTGYNGWHTGGATPNNTEVSTLGWVTATGDRPIASNPDGVFTIEIDKSELDSTFYWGIMSGADVASYYPAAWASSPWSEDASDLEPYTL